jgi:peptidoglycan-N-acetylglucosamine deacetylase
MHSDFNRNPAGKLIVTTSWDDGHTCDIFLTKLLDKYNLKGTFYCTKDYQGIASDIIRSPLNEDELKFIDNSQEIGAHTLTHPNLTLLSDDKAGSEISGSKDYLENILGHDVTIFCYPTGIYDDRLKNIVKKSGFIAARTCKTGDFSLPADPFEWHVTLHASNGSPLVTYDIWRKNHLPVASLFDWELRAKCLFDRALEKGGIFHLWGHSWEINNNKEWTKLENVFTYISRRKNVSYVTNSQIFLHDYSRVSTD